MVLLHINKESDEEMKIKQFDVVELKDKNKAIIKKINKRNSYLVEVINEKGIKVGEKTIADIDINKMLYSRRKER